MMDHKFKFVNWNASQWDRWHDSINIEVDSSWTNLVLSQYSYREPSDWSEYKKWLSPVYFILSALPNIISSDLESIEIFLEHNQKYFAFDSTSSQIMKSLLQDIYPMLSIESSQDQKKYINIVERITTFDNSLGNWSI